MDTRQRTLLKTAIKGHIASGEAVSSQAVLTASGLGVSSATIRSELSHLEKQGYLTQLHTSSGRVPTDAGYRMYVDELMDEEVISDPSTLIAGCEFGLDAVMQQLSSSVAQLMDYTTIVMAPSVVEDTLKMVHMVTLDVNRVLVVFLGALGLNHELVMDVELDVTQDELTKLSQVLTEKLSGQPISELTQSQLHDVITQLPSVTAILATFNDRLSEFSTQMADQSTVKVSGLSKLVRLPDFQTVQTVSDVLALLEENQLLSRTLKQLSRRVKNNVVIGKEAHDDVLETCSVVLSPIKLKASTTGTMAVIGPKRMSYSRVLPLVRAISEKMADQVKEV